MVRTRGSKINRDVLKLLRESVNEQDDSGCTALMFALEGAGFFGARKGNLSLIEILLEFGASPLLQDKQGRTALGYAIASNDKGTNQTVVNFLTQTVIDKTARREFEARNTYHIDKSGNLISSPKKAR